MRPLLMHPDRDFDSGQALPDNHETLARDLDLEALLSAMSAGDEDLYETARCALFSTETDPGVILYRQQVLGDCLRHPSVVREMHGIAVAAIAGRRKNHLFFRDRSPTSVLNTAVRAVTLYVSLLRKLRRIVAESHHGFESPGLRQFCDTLLGELSDDYLRMLEGQAKRLRFPGGVLLSACLGEGNIGSDYTVRLPRRPGWRAWITPWRRSGYTFRVSPRDPLGQKALLLIRGRGVNTVANTVARATDVILGLFERLKTELGFYVACLNLHERLSEEGRPTCFPLPAPPEESGISATGLYDVCLALRIESQLIGNDIAGQGRRLVIMTGANGGGKSTFLRSIGLAQMMMSSGMFVAAQSLRAGVAPAVFTHFRREEDAGLVRGKLGEELNRMDEIADRIGPECLLLCNESFASTNEREGSEIAYQMIRALTESRVTVFFVTHVYELARRCHAQGWPDALFLRAERRNDGARTFRLLPAEPLPTSFGQDLYADIFGVPDGTTPASGADAPD